jgi:hypothetical protein
VCSGPKCTRVPCDKGLTPRMLSPRLVSESYYGVCGMSNRERSLWDLGLFPDVILSAVDRMQMPVDGFSPATGYPHAEWCFRRPSCGVEETWDGAGRGSGADLELLLPVSRQVLCGPGSRSVLSIHVFGGVRIRDHAWAGKRSGKAGPHERRRARRVPAVCGQHRPQGGT